MGKKYKKTFWHSGDIITDIKLNNINNHISLSTVIAYQLPVIIPESDNAPLIINKSFNEIKDLILQGTICYLLINFSTTNQEHLIISLCESINFISKGISFDHGSIVFTATNNTMTQIMAETIADGDSENNFE